MRKGVAGAFALAVLVLCPGEVAAQGGDTGVAAIHQWVKVGRRTCLVDHFHDGNGTGANRRQAEQAAIQSWVEFTAWEYGGAWGRYAVAASKSMNCGQGSGTWTCTVQARPCRPY